MEITAGLIATAAIVGLVLATHQGCSLPFYGTVLIVIALTYVLFAAAGGCALLVHGVLQQARDG